MNVVRLWWPKKDVPHSFLGFHWPKRQTYVGDEYTIKQARKRAHEVAVYSPQSKRPCRIIEVKDTGYCYIIWEDGKWVEE